MIPPPDRPLFKIGLDRALVIPVNRVGAMGAGVAKEARRRFGYAFAEYSALLARDALPIGSAVLVRGLIFLPTKQHFRDPSRLEWVDAGLRALAQLDLGGLQGVHLPALGCGLGGLSWGDVEPLVRQHLEPSSTTFYVYPPGGRQVKV